jgi:ankyrin repeat protein
VASGHGKLDVVQLLLRELKADVNELHDGCTALFAAAYAGHEHVVRCLVKEFGANVHYGTKISGTALHAVALNGHVHIVVCLVKDSGANVNQATKLGNMASSLIFRGAGGA